MLVLLEKLKLNKEIISELNKDQQSSIHGGDWFTGGCTDGCGTVGTHQSYWNCTKQACTGDCEETGTRELCKFD